MDLTPTSPWPAPPRAEPETLHVEPEMVPLILAAVVMAAHVPARTLQRPDTAGRVLVPRDHLTALVDALETLDPGLVPWARARAGTP